MGYAKRKMQDAPSSGSTIGGSKSLTKMPGSQDGEKKKMKKTKTKMPGYGYGGKVGEEFGILDAKARARSAFSCGK